LTGFTNHLQKRRLLTLTEAVCRAHADSSVMQKNGRLLLILGLLNSWPMLLPVVGLIMLILGIYRSPEGILILFPLGLLSVGAAVIGVRMLKRANGLVELSVNALLREYPDVISYLGRKELLYDPMVAEELRSLIDKSPAEGQAVGGERLA
jgi:hypothetical protein